MHMHVHVLLQLFKKCGHVLVCANELLHNALQVINKGGDRYKNLSHTCHHTC